MTRDTWHRIVLPEGDDTSRFTEMGEQLQRAGIPPAGRWSIWFSRTEIYLAPGTRVLLEPMLSQHKQYIAEPCEPPQKGEVELLMGDDADWAQF